MPLTGCPARPLISSSLDGGGGGGGRRYEAPMNHQHIVMALHGLMDHVNVAELKPADPQLVHKYMEQYNIATGGDGGGGSVVDPIALFKAADTNADGRLMLTEAAQWIQGLAVHHFATSHRQASRDFRAALKATGRHVPTPAPAPAPTPPLTPRGGQHDASDSRAGGIDLQRTKQKARGLLQQTHLLSWPDLLVWRPEWNRRNEGNVRIRAFLAADTDGDERLDASEFVAFRHPEVSDRVRQQHARRFLDSVDMDGDSRLNVTEFLGASLLVKEAGANRDSVQAYDFRAESRERRREFTDDLDTNGDALLDVKEVAALLDPRHPAHAAGEAVDIFLVCDMGGDHEVEISEISSHQCASHLQKEAKMLHFQGWMATEVAAMYAKMTDRLRRLATRSRDEL